MNASFAAGKQDGFDPNPQRDPGRVNMPDGSSGKPSGAAREMATTFGVSDLIDDLIDYLAPSPWGAHAGSPFPHRVRRKTKVRQPLYSPQERLRRDRSPWTIVQAILAPLQFLSCAVSVALVVHYFWTGQGYEIATASILVKTAALYAIMITGSIWEKEVFGKWLFAPAFFWEDAFSMLVLGLQTAYLSALILGWGTPRQQMMISMAAYAAYAINASQFLWKLRQARLDVSPNGAGVSGRMGQPA
jgi:3-vinyl bacteriochlorophyllide hydratase